MRWLDVMRARREGLEPAQYRPLAFAAPLTATERRPRLVDTLLSAESVVGEDRTNCTPGTDPWAIEVAEDLARRLWTAKHVAAARYARSRVRSGLHLIRMGWLAHCCARTDLARYMFAKAEGEWLRTSMGPLADTAGDAWVKSQRRAIVGSEVHGDGPKRTADIVRRAHESFPEASNRELAKLTGKPEATVRRHRPRKP